MVVVANRRIERPCFTTAEPHNDDETTIQPRGRRDSTWRLLSSASGNFHLEPFLLEIALQKKNFKLAFITTRQARCRHLVLSVTCAASIFYFGKHPLEFLGHFQNAELRADTPTLLHHLGLADGVSKKQHRRALASSL